MATTATLQSVITEFPAEFRIPMWHFVKGTGGALYGTSPGLCRTQPNG